MADDLSSNKVIRDLMDRVRRLEVATPLYSASVTDGRLRFIGGLLRVDSGGRVEIVGTLEIDGTTDITGPTTVTGTFTVEGPLTVEGPWSLDGDGDITGDVSVTGDVDVESGGRVVVHGGGGNVVLDSSFSSPRVQMGSAQIDGGDSSFTFGVGTTTIYFLDQTIRIASMPTITGVTPNVYADGLGKLYRVI